MTTGSQSLVAGVEKAWALVGPLIGGGGVWAYLSTRSKGRAEAPAALVTAAAHFQTALTAEAERLMHGLSERLARVEADNARLDERCAAAERAHDDCQAEVQALKRRLEEAAFGPPLPFYEPKPQPKP